MRDYFQHGRRVRCVAGQHDWQQQHSLWNRGAGKTTRSSTWCGAAGVWATKQFPQELLAQMCAEIGAEHDGEERAQTAEQITYREDFDGRHRKRALVKITGS